jgi:hypothetical protein
VAGQAQVVTQTEWRDLAEERLADAGALLAAERWAGLYYVVGYAVECSLKACLVKFVEKNPHIVFRDNQFSKDCWTHNLNDLLKACELDSLREADAFDAQGAATAFGTNWQIVAQWNEHSRYRKMSKVNAVKLHKAITHPSEGVMSWVKKYW